MTEFRPFDERPAARPSQPAQQQQPLSPQQAQTPRQGIGCMGCSLIVIGVLILVVIISIVVAAATSSRSANDGGSSSTGSHSKGSTDPIEQARVVLGGEYSYESIQSATDSALAATETAVTDDSRNRAWSAVLKVTDNLSNVAPMDVMQCVTDIGPSSGFSFPDAAALCATTIHTSGTW